MPKVCQKLKKWLQFIGGKAGNLSVEKISELSVWSYS